MTASDGITPVMLEIFRNRVEAVAEEMGITLQRSAFSANIKERRDFSCAVFDAAGRLLGQAAHVPVHLGSMPESVAAALSACGALAAGDAVILNDPYAGGTHLPDLTLVSPVHVGGMLRGYVANRAHHADVGGASPGSMTLSTHIDQEGLRLAPTFLLRGGVAVGETYERIFGAVRTPAERAGDLDAQLAANAAGAHRLARIIRDVSAAGWPALADALIEYARRMTAAAIGSIPDGVYRFEDVLDDDGAGTSDIAIRAAVTIAGERAIVDLAASADQVAGCVNCPAAVAKSAAYYCFQCLLDEGVPLNAGCFAQIDVIVRPGSVVGAVYPAAVVAGNTETSQRIVDVIFGALARALPGSIPAASCGTMSSIALGGVWNDRPWTYYETIGGGSGASPDGDGASCVQCHMTNTLNTPAEALEMQYPLRVERFERVPNTGGAGRFSGGDGIVRELRALAACEGTILSDRRTHAPYGLAGGASGEPGANRVAHDGGKRVSKIEGKARFQLDAGDRLIVMTPGGGGFGACGEVGHDH